jgi:hypothetical protein
MRPHTSSTWTISAHTPSRGTPWTLRPLPQTTASRLWQRHWGRWGVTPQEGVPLVLASEDTEGHNCLALPWILVRTVDEARTLRDRLQGLPAYQGDNALIQYVYAHFHELTIIPLVYVAAQLKARHHRWGKLETRPVEDIPR